MAEVIIEDPVSFQELIDRTEALANTGCFCKPKKPDESDQSKELEELRSIMLETLLILKKVQDNIPAQ